MKVEWKKLGEMGTFARGNGLQKKDFTETGIGCIHYGQIHTFYGASTDHTKSFVSAELAKKLRKAQKGDLIIATTSEDVEACCKAVAWLGEGDICISGDSYVYSHNQNPMYMSYLFQTELFAKQKRLCATGTKVIRVSGESMEKFIFPFPPLSEQQRIVSILDTFTASIDNLKAQIAERRKQYEHYRDQLLDLEGKPGVEMKTIDEVCNKVCSGGTPNTKSSQYYGGNIPWLRTQEVDWKYIKETEIHITEEGLNNSSAKWIPANCIIVAMYGATAAKCAINAIPLTTNQACCNLQINESVARIKYVFHWICKSYYSLKALGEGSQNNINSEKVKTYPIPIPSLADQHRIVSILDTFETSIANLEAQLSLRQKQYEYYRNKLLTFEEGIRG